MKMRVTNSVLAVLCAVALTAPLAPALAQSDGDVKNALRVVKISWRDYGSCLRPRLCAAYFESFGVALTFSDGTLSPFAHAQRSNASGHDCIQNARASLEHGDRAMAVQWVMAAQMQDLPVRNWLGEHPDAVLEALRACCVG
jgi:hypothetical protein